MKWFQRQSEDHIDPQLDQRLHIVRADQIGNVFYWYDQDSGAFLLQGCTDQDIRSQLQQYWADHIFVVSATHMIMGPDFDQLIEFDCQTQGITQ
jgi:hypothetical protein